MKLVEELTCTLKTLSKIERKKEIIGSALFACLKITLRDFFCLCDLDVSIAVAAAISLYGFIRNFFYPVKAFS